MAKILLDLHEIIDKGLVVDAELNRVLAKAVEKELTILHARIVPGITVHRHLRLS
ncbi:hypothetical protein ACFLTZ_00570 [Chloroflexota bacterium]